MGSHSFLQGTFPTKGLNLGLPHCRQILYCLSHQETLFFLISTIQMKTHVSIVCGAFSTLSGLILTTAMLGGGCSLPVMLRRLSERGEELCFIQILLVHFMVHPWGANPHYVCQLTLLVVDYLLWAGMCLFPTPKLICWSPNLQCHRM